MMARQIMEKKVLIILITVTVVLVGYNISSVEYQKIEAHRQAEEDTRIERERLEEIKTIETKEIAEFDREYERVKTEFEREVDDLSEEINSQVSNIDELKELTTQRIDLSKEFQDQLSQMDIPEPLKDYYRLKMEFLASDIEAATLVFAYYNSGNYSTYPDKKLDEAFIESVLWLQKAEEELKRVYREYDLEYLLEKSF